VSDEEPREITEEELLEQLEKISVDDVILQTAVTLVNLSGSKLAGEPRDLDQARRGIDAARALLPFCPDEASGPIKDALAQLQMMFVRESQEPGAAPEPEPEPEQKPESKLWTPPGSTS